MNDSIFRPHFSTTPETSSLLDSLDRQRWLVDNMLIMPKHQAWISRDIRIQRVAGTTRIEGATLDEDAVRNLERSGPVTARTDDEQANVNALQAYEFVDFVSDQDDIPVDELVIRQLNRYFIRGAAETLTPGAYRKGENKVGRFTPPNQGDVPALMRSFSLWLRQDDDTHPVLKAGIAHIHMVAVHPFWDGNGRTARALSTLILQRSLFGFKKLLSLEKLLFGDRDEYFDALERTVGAGFAADYDMTSWLEFFTRSVYVNALLLVESLTEWHKSMEQGHEFMDAAGVAPRLADAVALATQTGSITRGVYAEITGVSPVTASRDLAKLVELGFLVPEGKTRSRVYRPHPEHLGGEPDSDSEQEQLRLPEGEKGNTEV